MYKKLLNSNIDFIQWKADQFNKVAEYGKKMLDEMNSPFQYPAIVCWAWVVSEYGKDYLLDYGFIYKNDFN